MEIEKKHTNRSFYADAFFLGFTLIGAQIILLREFLLVFNGNELVIGLLMAIWLIATALGSWTGRFFNGSVTYKLLMRLLFVVVTVYPLIAAFGLEYYRNTIFIQGRMVSINEIFIYSFIVLLPLCFSGGLLFNLLNSSNGKGEGRLQNYYALESMGSLVGGALISLFFVYFLEIDNFRSLEYLILINFIFFGISDFRQKKSFQSFVFLIAAIATMMVIYNYDLNKIAKGKLFLDQELILSQETAYGNLSITKTNEQLNFYENGLLISATGDVIQREEDVHYAMLQQPEAKKILLIGGGITGTTNELLKYPSVEQVDYLETNPSIFSLTKDFTNFLSDRRITTYATDPAIFVNWTKEKYDVILVNQPPPSSVQLNRFFTAEFYLKIKKILQPDGVILTRLPSSENYLSEEELELQSSVFNSLKNAFAYVELIPAGKHYFLASDNKIEIDFIRRLDNQQLNNLYVNSDYINDELLKMRSEQIKMTYLDDAQLNHDFKPTVYLMYIKYWLSQFGSTIWIFLIVSLLAVIFFLVFARPFTSAMFTSGFTGAATEITLLIAFQVIFGYLYLFLGVIITIFMAGLVVGAFLSRECRMRNTFTMMMFTQLFTAIFILSIAVKIYFLKDLENVEIIQTAFTLMVFVISGLVGMQYGVSVCKSKESPGKTVSSIYSADLIGAALGSLLVVIYIIPVFGIYNTLIALAGYHFVTILSLFIKKKLKYLQSEKWVDGKSVWTR